MLSKTIFLVEDNPDDVALTLRAFKQANISNNISIARNGEEALDMLFAMEKLPAVVLLDLNLPKMDGLEVLKALRENERTSMLPVVILTSSMEDRDIAEGYALGANSYIVKPVDFGQFATAAKQVGLYWLVLNETPPKQ
ncbi:MAG: response regulator [Nitrospinae bacterium]|nr:response regulator [Nitrospinota bacterium]